MADRRRMDPRALGLSEEELRQLGFMVRGRVGAATDAPERPPDAVPSQRRRRDPALIAWSATVAVLAIAAWSASPQRRLPPPLPAAGPDTAFSAARAMAQLVELAQRPHPGGSPEHDRVRERLVARLTGLGLEPEIQTAVSATRDASTVLAATVRNVVARLPGSQSTGAVALVAHYDAAPLSPGAADNGMGAAAVLETARALLAGAPLRNDVLIVLTDAGSVDALGARAFVGEHPRGREVAAAISVDVIGGGGAAIAFEVADGRHGALADAADGPATSSLARTLLGTSTHPELAPFVEAGASGVGLTSLGHRARRHQPADVATELDEATLQDLGAQLLAIARGAAARDLSESAGEAGAASVGLALPRVGVVRYSQARSILYAVAILLIWLLLAAMLLGPRGASRKRVVVSAVLGLAVVGASTALAGALLAWAGARHAELGALDTALQAEGPHLAAAVALALACGSAAYAVARRWCRADELIVGALAVPLAATLWVSVTAPAASAASQWPLAAALLCAGVIAVAGPARTRSVWARATVVALTVPLLLVLVPALELAAGVWTLRGAPRLGALFGIASVLLFPLWEGLGRPRSWLTPAVAAGAAAALVTIALPSVRGGAAHPVPTALVYLAHEPAPSLLPAGARSEDGATLAGARRMLGEWLIVPGAGERWGRSWVVDPPTGSRDPGVVFLPDPRYEIAGSGPETVLTPPVARLLGTRDDGLRLRARVAVRSGLGGEMLGVRLEDADGAEITAVAGLEWATGTVPVRTLTHWGRPISDELVLEIALPSEHAELVLLVLEHHLRPREVLVQGVFQRPDSLVPHAAAGSDRVVQRTLLRVPVVGPAVASAEPVAADASGRPRG